ncbi:MAG: hypothetical protein EA408_00340 [Marinilabiliales bacterium]|nr:MAG: hypothetical protein EA408_00340 [Marinilabiliales bacterium]
MNLTGKSPNSFCRLIIAVLLPVTVLLQGCTKGVFFPDDPSVIEYSLPAFSDLQINSIFEIELRNDSLYSVRLEGNRNILENISVNVEADTLKLSDDNTFTWLPDYPRTKLVISLPDLKRIWINSPSKLYSTDTLALVSLSIYSIGLLAETDITVNAGYLYFTTDYNNFGYYIFRGFAHEARFRTFGSAELDAGELIVNNANVRNYSIGNSHIHVENHLRAWLGHYGNIYYSGSPSEVIIESMNSRGRLIQTP